MANATIPDQVKSNKNRKKKRTASADPETSLYAALQDAIGRGELEEVKRAFQDVQQSPRLVGDKKNLSFAKALWRACEKDEHEIAEFLLRSGVSANERVDGGKSALMVCGTAPMVHLLVKHRAEVNATDQWGKTPLMHAKTEAVAQALIDHKAKINLADNGGRTALWHAVLLDRTGDVAHCLLKNEATVDVCDHSGRTLLSKAAEKSLESVVREVLRKGAPVGKLDKSGRNILHHLCEDEKLAARLHQPSRTATTEADRRIVDLILAQCEGEDINAKTVQDRKTPLHMAVAANNLYFVKRLLKQKTPKANIKAVDRRQKTALHIAANAGRIDIARELIKHDADVNAKSDTGWTPLHVASDRQNNSLETVQLLIGEGADVSRQTREGKLALHVAAESGNIDVVQCLLKSNGMHVAWKDRHGNTPLLSAAKAGHQDIVSVLFEHGFAATLSQPELEASRGYTASLIDFAPSTGRSSTSKQKNSNQRKSCSMYDLLVGQFEVTTENRQQSQSKVHEPGNFRWIHLPSNNVAWAQQILIRWFMKQNEPDADKFKRLHSSFDNEHVGNELHAHYMRPACQVRGSLGLDGDTLANKPSTKRKNHMKDAKQPPTLQNIQQDTTSTALDSTYPDMYLFMPYIHCERQSYQVERQKVVDEAQAKKHEAQGSSPQLQPATPSSFPPQRKCTDLSHFQEGAERNLLKAHISSPKCSLHIRRTLDQSYYRTIKTHPERDNDQVVLRYQKRRNEDRQETDRDDPRLLMVDQLWMWIVSEDLILTAFPNEWEERDNDPRVHNVLESIVNDIHSPGRSRNISNVQELAAIIAGHCSGAFDRRNTVEGEHLFLDMFDAEIGHAMNQGTKLFEKFENVSKEASQWLEITRGMPGRGRAQYKSHILHSRPSEPNLNSGEDKWKTAFKEERWKMAFSPRLTLLQKLLDITEETALIRDIRDVRDELEILKLIFKQQETLLDEMKRGIIGSIDQTMNTSRTRITKIFEEQKKYIENPLQDIERMEKQAERVEKSMADLLEQKQKHANAIQVADTARQGLTLMVFTVVTVIFLPMSFLASIFTINIREFPSEMTLHWVSRYVFGIGVAIAFFCVMLAFYVERLHSAVKTFLWNVFKWRLGRNSDPDLHGDKLGPSDSTTSNSRSMIPSSTGASISSSGLMKKFWSRSQPQRSSQGDVELGQRPR